MTDQVACRRCRTQKLRCDRGRPRCARCTRVDALCSYPPAPDRKQIAARRRAATTRTRKLASPLSTNDIQLLIDIYFTNVFNAGLILRRPTFETRVTNEGLPDHCLLAVLALALNFIQVETSHNRHVRSQLQRLDNPLSLAEEFALLAGRKVLPEMDSPSLDHLQTCHNLGFFWFSRGQSQRNATFSGLAYRSARNKLMERHELPWLEAEQFRRCFWVGWLQACINSDDYAVGSAFDSLALDTLLPVSEAYYIAGLEEATVSLAQTQIVSTDLSIWAQLFSLLAHWTKVRDHLAARRATSTSAILQAAQQILQELELWASRMHPSMAYTRHNLCEYVVHKKEPLFAAIHAMLHQIRLTLHASLVPRFCGVHSAELPVHVIKIHAESTMRCAHSLADLASDLIALNCDFATLPPYIGYCMYAAGSIHLTMITSAGVSEKARSQFNLTAIVLREMKPFWSILAELHSRLLLMHEAQLSQDLLTTDDVLSTRCDLGKNTAAYSLTNLKRDKDGADSHGQTFRATCSIAFEDIADTQFDSDLVDPQWWQVDSETLALPELAFMNVM